MTIARAAPVGDLTTANVFATVLTRGPISRTEIARRLGLSSATVSKTVRPLIDSGYLIEQGIDAPPGRGSGSGRPVVPLRVVPEREIVIGVKLTGDRVVAVAVDLLANVRASREALLSSRQVDHVLQVVVRLVRQLQQDVAHLGQVTRVGVGVGGHVDAASGLVRFAPFLGWHDLPLARRLSAEIGLPTVVENDVNALTIAEQWFGAGVDAPSLAVVTIGAGVGCGLVIAGALVHGAVGLAGELGHVPIAPDGPPCRCGNTGCVEALASEEAIVRQARLATGRTELDLAAAAQLARDGDAGAAGAFTSAGDALGRALAVVANLVNPHRIVLSGEGLAASDLFEAAVRESFATHGFGQAADCDLVVRPLPEHTWARGAAAVAIQHLFIGPLSSTGR